MDQFITQDTPEEARMPTAHVIVTDTNAKVIREYDIPRGLRMEKYVHSLYPDGYSVWIYPIRENNKLSSKTVVREVLTNKIIEVHSCSYNEY